MKINAFLRFAFLAGYLILAGFAPAPQQLPYIFTETRNATVYVCDSPYAKKYHFNSNCPGLNACKHTVVKISKADAESKGLTLCSRD